MQNRFEEQGLKQKDRSQRLTPKFYSKSFISLVITFNSMVLHDPF